VGTAIGLGLNNALIVFGFLTISYVVLGGLSFKKTKDVEELIEKTVGPVARVTRLPPARWVALTSPSVTSAASRRGWTAPTRKIHQKVRC